MTGEAGSPEVLVQQPMHAIAPGDVIRRAWKIAAIVGGLLFACLVIAHWDTAVGLVRLWDTDSYGHGPFVLGASVYIVWRKRETLFEAAPRPAISGPLVLLLITLAWLLVHVMAVKAGRELLFVASIAAIVLSVSGWRTVRLLAFPLAYLLLAISAWDVLLRPLQNLTAIFSTDLLQHLGLPVFRETHYIDTPNGQFLVEEACAGLRTFLAGMAVGSLYAYISYRNAWRRVVFLGVTTVWALAINVLRVAITVGSAFPLGMGNFVIRHHGTLGWILFGIGLIPLFSFGRWLANSDPATQEGSQASGTAPKPPSHAPRAAYLPIIALGAAIAIGLGPASAAWYAHRSDAQRVDLPALIPVAGPWRVSANSTSSWKPIFHGTNGELHLTYAANGKTVWLYTGYYTNEGHGGKLIYYANRLYDPIEWQAVRSRTLHVEVAGQPLALRELDLSNSGGTRNRIVWYWYRVAGANTTSQIGAKLLRIRSIFSGGNSAVIALASDVTHSRAATRKALQAVLDGIFPKLVPELDGPR